MIPEKLLKNISCSCESGCNKQRCGCRKHGLKCTNLCINCQENYTNRDKEIFEDLSDSEEPANNLGIEIEEPEDVDNFEETESQSSIDEEKEKPRCKTKKII